MHNLHSHKIGVAVKQIKDTGKNVTVLHVSKYVML